MHKSCKVGLLSPWLFNVVASSYNELALAYTALSLSPIGSTFIRTKNKDTHATTITCKLTKEILVPKSELQGF